MNGNGQVEDPMTKALDEDEDAGRSAWVKNFSSVLGICVIGMVGWVAAWQTGMWKPAAQGENGGVDMAAGAQALGYISAVCYLGWVFFFIFFPS